MKLWRDSNSSTSQENEKKRPGSVVTIAGPLLSYPTGSPCPTPLLIFHRPGTEQTALSKSDLTALKKGFNGRVIEEKFGKEREGMPANKDEWTVVMKFWSDVLQKTIRGEGIYRIGSV